MTNKVFYDEENGVTEVDEVNDRRGVLKVLQGNKIPFAVRRLFWITGVPQFEIRGNHGHFKTKQLLCCIQGVITITVYSPSKPDPIVYVLTDHDSYYLPPGHWISMEFSTSQDVLLVAADRDYDAEDVFLEPIK